MSSNSSSRKTTEHLDIVLIEDLYEFGYHVINQAHSQACMS
jgi:hypothetical protein